MAEEHMFIRYLIKFKGLPIIKNLGYSLFFLRNIWYIGENALILQRKNLSFIKSMRKTGNAEWTAVCTSVIGVICYCSCSKDLAFLFNKVLMKYNKMEKRLSVFFPFYLYKDNNIKNKIYNLCVEL